MNLTGMELDLLKEAFNAGAGTAAGVLEELTGGVHGILVSVREVQLIPFANLEERIGVDPNENFSAVIQSFEGPFGGTAVFLYSASESLELVRAMLGEEIATKELPVMQADALREVGNVVLNSSIGGIGQMLNATFETGLPILKSGHCREIFTDGAGYAEDDELLYMRMRFALSAQSLSGHLGFSLDMKNGDALQRCLAGSLKAMGGALG